MGRLYVRYASSGYALISENLLHVQKELAEATDEVFSAVDGDSGRFQRLGERYGLLKELEACFRANGWDKVGVVSSRRKG